MVLGNNSHVKFNPKLLDPVYAAEYAKKHNLTLAPRADYNGDVVADIILLNKNGDPVVINGHSFTKSEQPYYMQFYHRVPDPRDRILGGGYKSWLTQALPDIPREQKLHFQRAGFKDKKVYTPTERDKVNKVFKHLIKEVLQGLEPPVYGKFIYGLIPWFKLFALMYKLLIMGDRLDSTMAVKFVLQGMMGTNMKDVRQRFLEGFTKTPLQIRAMKYSLRAWFSYNIDVMRRDPNKVPTVLDPEWDYKPPPDFYHKATQTSEVGTGNRSPPPKPPPFDVDSSEPIYIKPKPRSPLGLGQASLVDVPRTQLELQTDVVRVHVQPNPLKKTRNRNITSLDCSCQTVTSPENISRTTSRSAHHLSKAVSVGNLG